MGEHKLSERPDLHLPTACRTDAVIHSNTSLKTMRRHSLHGTECIFRTHKYEDELQVDLPSDDGI